MKEKYITATDESYKDLSNLKEKLKKHEAFELELKANNARLNQLNEVRSVFIKICKNCRTENHQFAFVSPFRWVFDLLLLLENYLILKTSDEILLSL